MECRRGDIYFVDFGRDTESNLQCGIRPALVVSNNRANENSPVITVIPLTARTYKRPHFPTHVLIPKTSGTGLARNSMALAEQVSTIDKSYLMEKKGVEALTGRGSVPDMSRPRRFEIAGCINRFVK